MEKTLSIIFVNYNVKYFLDLALLSVQKACASISHEIFIVDNNSSDGSLEYLKSNYDSIKYIASDENLGFSKANNLAIQQASGKYILLLNPDTVVQENTLKTCIQFLEENKNCGAVGVKMLDGKGSYLPESKRGLPTPWTAFYKISGISNFLKSSAKYNRYYLGHTSPEIIQPIEVLTGAFIMMPHKVLQEIGSLDEAFFMYGEDVDLSYRISKAGYQLYYLPEPPIIHYKGESTKKNSFSYVKTFYQAMILFAHKHYTSSQAKTYSFVIKIAIYLKAFLSLISRLGNLLYLPLLDMILIYAGMYGIKNFWESAVKAAEGITYPETYILINVPIYTLIWVITVYFSGGYDKPFRLLKAIRGAIVGTVLVAAFYGFLEDAFRFSRAMILFGGGWTVVTILFSRLLINSFKQRTLRFESKPSKNLVFIGSQAEVERGLSLLLQTEGGVNYVGFIHETSENREDYLGTLEDLSSIINLYQVNQLIFCTQTLPFSSIISSMHQLGRRVNFRIFPEARNSMVGSNSKNTSGDIFANDVNYKIASPASKRNKRVFDITTSLVLLFFYVPLLFFVYQPIKFLQNIVACLFGTKTWIGYYGVHHSLPQLRVGVISPIQDKKNTLEVKNWYKVNQQYAKNFEAFTDLNIMLKNFRFLGN